VPELAHHSIGVGPPSCRITKLAHRLEDGGDAAVPVDVCAYPGACELIPQTVLRAVDGDQRRTQREDPFGVRIEKSTDTWKRADFCRKRVEAADANNLRACADGEQHFSQGRDERHDAALRGLRRRRPRHDCRERRAQQGGDD
jgi:hypothetical protein